MRVIDEAVKNNLALKEPETIHNIVREVENEFYDKNEWQKQENKQKLKKFHTEWYETMMENEMKKLSVRRIKKRMMKKRTNLELMMIKMSPPMMGSPLLESAEPNVSLEFSPSDMVSPEGRDANQMIKRSPEKEEKSSVKRGHVEVEKVTYKGDVRDIDYLLKKTKK